MGASRHCHQWICGKSLPHFAMHIFFVQNEDMLEQISSKTFIVSILDIISCKTWMEQLLPITICSSKNMLEHWSSMTLMEQL